MPQTPPPVDAIETHISQLFFTPERVLKLLKPVDNGFLSFADRDRRMEAAEAEYHINRRISPDVYLGTADLIEGGEAVDRMIVMRRLPAELQLDKLVGHPGFLDHVTRVARFIAAFHARQEPVTGDPARMATGERLAENWGDNLSTLAPLTGSVVPVDAYRRVELLVERYLSGRTTLFEERISGGRIRDGHGDLRAEHVFCLDDGPRVIDALAFRDDYRIADVLCDIAFLAMDLHRLCGPATASRFMKAYEEFTAEQHPSTLAHHYVAYRAHVRAKVAALRFGQGDTGAAAEAAAYHRLALEHLEHCQVRLILVGGGAGAGKSTVADGVASRTGAIWLRTDDVRSAIVGDRPAAAEGPGEGRYRPELTDAVYRELLQEAEGLLARGRSVVLDATWQDDRHRSMAREMAGRTCSELSELRCVLPLSIARERIVRRMASMYEPSDATPEIATHIDRQFQPWPEAVEIDTEGSIPRAVESAVGSVLGLAGTTPRPVHGITVDDTAMFTRESILFYFSTSDPLTELRRGAHDQIRT